MLETLDNILDVTLLEPRQKHPTIFVRFDALKEGETLTIHNDHDPKPLYYQLLGERGNIFTWEYLEEGPEWWKVKISKRVSGEETETLGEIAVKDIRKAQVFKKYGLDFCCGGKKTLQVACAEKGLDIVQVEKELQGMDKITVSRPLPYQDWSLDFLTDYIINTHHAYVRKFMPDILTYGKKVAAVHGDVHPELKQIYELIKLVEGELTPHMLKEEQILFPIIKKIAAAEKANSPLAETGIASPVHVMESEHEQVGNYMESINRLSNNYSLPSDACASYTLLFKMLSEFEDDLHLHIHLENNILFPKAIELAKKLQQQ
ncbi:hypothetical protein BH09BAC5_BH09BAC5_03010 [soil metagenome]